MCDTQENHTEYGYTEKVYSVNHVAVLSKLF